MCGKSINDYNSELSSSSREALSEYFKELDLCMNCALNLLAEVAKKDRLLAVLTQIERYTKTLENKEE